MAGLNTKLSSKQCCHESKATQHMSAALAHVCSTGTQRPQVPQREFQHQRCQGGHCTWADLPKARQFTTLALYCSGNIFFSFICQPNRDYPPPNIRLQQEGSFPHHTNAIESATCKLKAFLHQARCFTQYCVTQLLRLIRCTKQQAHSRLSGYRHYTGCT